MNLTKQLAFLKEYFVPSLKCHEELFEWIKAISCRIIIFFLRSASIIRPISENGRLTLANDIVQLEFGINGLISACKYSKKSSSLHEAIASLKSFKNLLFSSLKDFHSEQAYISMFEPVVIIHHLIVRSNEPDLMLPHTFMNLAEYEYLNYLSSVLDNHSVDKNHPSLKDLIQGILSEYVKRTQMKNKEKFDPEYPIILKYFEKIQK